ncbi:MAG: anti-sigma regulatory factor [Caloramator sp.]|nr:anti-sigma regulatory factor [Caloramator sp.]
MRDEYIKLHYDVISGDYIRGGEASSSLKKALMQLGINSSVIRKACIGCYEAEMNIVIHSFGGEIEADIYKDKIEITAMDRGPGIENINLAMQEGYSTASEEAREMGFGGGMGLPNMKRSSDVFFIESVLGEYTLIKMIININ